MSYSDQQIRDAVDAVFGAYDKDGSNSLDPQECFNLINDALKHANCNKQVTPDQVQQFVGAVDKNGDGNISKPELYQIFKQCLNS